MPFIEVEGNKTYYSGDSERGKTAIIFCHGSGGGHHNWNYQLKALKEVANPIAVDLPGHGRSGGKPAANIDTYCRFLKNFAEALKLNFFIPAGHSLGGAITLSYALNYPDNTEGLILIGSGAKLRVLPSILEELRRGKIPESMVNYLYSEDAPEELRIMGQRELERTDAAVFLADLTACNHFDVIEKVNRINKPTLLICGDEDLLTPVKYSLFLRDSIPNGRLAIVNGAGHMVMLEKPGEVNRAITAFIKEELS